ncbi:CcoQ/FixQ family Cbb3-type cytochrome c oxidase assembly chaperone [Chryseobacterium oryzae]|uniref:CcoQ/FixQ family Cbb3-type cytochrome c oxidase assembly chaperone n=1 Tax=Chryseobacterium oryzae TaxID=2929799 RepID=A0ABY4BCW3_9FLAO|nr:CcoQ/FixQ family Cbb3-type cytochrome c oxidase assembly chaperone [Chryseobacterium oryzae]UOE36983.1 CcoQ/FixQ family Cbb3-type cytochrome c oxidase assembly chaperone [Chryseobacterium oryzae]
MIPSNFKDFLANAENTGLYQTVALILFMLFFLILLILVFSKSKNYYVEVSNLPLDKEED